MVLPLAVAKDSHLRAAGLPRTMTFLGNKTGKQFVVIAAGGSGFYGTLDMPEKSSDTLAAFALPDDSL